MGLGFCKNQCVVFEKTTKQIAYATGGCFCKNCNYYYQKKFSRCPCCNSKVRYSTRSNKYRLETKVKRI